ncbi:MAG: DUF4384 domain-containing protein [Lautropia sp.]
MNRPPHHLTRRLLGTALAAATFAGCSTVAVKADADKRIEQAKKGPAAAPYRSITSFSDALRCMDNAMIDYGVRDVSTLVEELQDQTKKVNAGTRDMLISALSQMSRRSRALRVVAFGRDAGNMVGFLEAAQRQNAYQTIPQFDIKGSVTQWDENVIRTQKDAGIGFQPFVNLGVSGDAAASVLGLDLTMLNTEDMAVLPGVTSKNSVVIFKQGTGVDGDAAYKKFGISFSMTFTQAEGQTQALRGLIELAAVELMGKLTKIPYWTCLGADAANNEDIKLEMSDWYYAMATTPGNLIAYFQNQLNVRGFYDGPVDGQFNPAIDQAIANFRVALGLSNEAVIEQELFTRYLTTDPRTIKRPDTPVRFEQTAQGVVPGEPQPVVLAQQSGAQPGAQGGPQAPTPQQPVAQAPQGTAPNASAQPPRQAPQVALSAPAPAPVPVPVPVNLGPIATRPVVVDPLAALPPPQAKQVAAPQAARVPTLQQVSTRPGAAPGAPLELAMATRDNRTTFAPGDVVDLRIQPNRGANLYCYLQDENNQVARIFPNRWASSPFVSPNAPLALPGNMRFQIVMNQRQVTEVVSCIATETDVSNKLPREAFGGDFEPLPVSGFEQIRQSFLNVTGGQFAQESFHVSPK